MNNAELIEALRCRATDIRQCEACAFKDACYGGTLELIAADALEECMKKENALRSLIDGRGDPVSCNVDAILKGEYE